MDQRSVRVVVGRGDPSGADLRATLQDGGFEVVGEASSVEDLARLVQANPPDVVVLDDTIGVTAAQVVGELAPDAKLVVIWPAAVLPVAGATRIDAEDLHTSLVPAVATAAGVLLTGLSTIERPEWIDAVRKDPATLREKLAAGDSMPVRPSVTELQRPHGYPTPSTGWRRKSSRPAAAAGAAAIGAAAASATPSPTDNEDATVNRRLGLIALGGAVAAGALMIALSLGRTTPTVVRAESFVPGISAPSNFIPDPNDDTTGGGPGTSPGGAQGGGTGTDGTTGSGTTGSGTTGSGTTGTTGSTGSGTKDGSGTTPTIGVGSGAGSAGGVRAGWHRGASGPGTGGGHGSGQASGTPGKSGAHNPHGGPPGLTGEHPSTGGKSAGHPVHPSQKAHRHKH